MPTQGRDSWACDWCGTQGFATFEDAKAHESNCEHATARKRQRPGSPPGQSYPGMAPLASGSNDYDSFRPKLRRISILAPDEMHQLDSADALACQSLEMFEAGPELAADAQMGQISPSQLGIRCVHCAQQPTNQYSMYFPGNLASIASSIHMVANRHLTSCPAVPRHVQEELERARRRDHADADEERNRMALISHISLFCRQAGIVDMYPPQSGIVINDSDARFAATLAGNPRGEAQLPPSSTEARHSMAPMMGDSIAATPLARKDQQEPNYGGDREGGYAAGYPTPYMGTPSGGLEGPPGASPAAAGYPPYGASPYGMSPAGPQQGEFPFYQEANSSWSCRYCSSVHPQYRDQGSVWTGPNPPPGQFIDQHLNICRGYNHHMQQSSGMYQGQPPPSYYPPSGPFGPPPSSAQFGPLPGWGGPPASQYSMPGGDYSYPPSSHELSGMMAPLDLPGERSGMGGPSSMAAPRGLAPAGPTIPGSGGDLASRQAIDYLVASRKDAYTEQPEGESNQLVLEEDKMLLTDYFFHLMKQLRVCRFSESDRKTRGGKRENIAVGYGGLQCVHCSDAPNARKFFWSNVDRLANSFAEIPGHVLKCRRCPTQTKAALSELKLRHPEQMAKLPRGSQKVFFRRMWRRLHERDPKTEAEQAEEKESEAKPPAVEVASPPGAAIKSESGTPGSQQQEITGSSPEHSTDESTVFLERSTEEAAKALAASVTQTDPPSPSSRVLLAIPEDKEWLSDMDCFVRRNMEVFCATQEDVRIADLDRKYPVNVGQVGIRCIHCALVKDGKGARGSAVAFPYSISGIYESVREFQRLHLESCTNLPPATKVKLEGCKGAASLSSVLRKYYVVAAKALGMYDTPDGIRSGGESLPLGSSAAFAFTESKVGEAMRKGEGAAPSPAPSGGFTDTGPAITPLESRKRKHPSDSGDAQEDEANLKEEEGEPYSS